ncbi:carbohydrate sulfotransferase 11-like isoform X2 [Eriocheir sinensis]|uniref:carbohydrate sulfotransferase 11-like isoform X2 n=1 Tax=Eriocheir sinensis TaxID=95602 RepID=UPI0021C6D279|nr:carbohydrate sulfotransferase 11-like isoform X2 [Eriocheir sinensis]
MPPNMFRIKNIVFALLIITFIIYANINVNQVTKPKIVEYFNELTSTNFGKRRHEPNTTTENVIRIWRENQNTLNENVQVTYVSVILPQEIVSTTDSPPPIVAETGTLANTGSLGKENEVIFPDITNCSMKEYKRKLAKHKNSARANIYICRKWHEPNPNDPLWPMVVPPTNGSILKTFPIHHQDPEVERQLLEQVAVQEERLALLATTCQSHPHLAVPSKVKLVWDTSRTPPLIYCPVYKVASTTWAAYFLRLAHIRASEPRTKKKAVPDAHTIMSEIFHPPKKSKEKNTIFPKSLRFIVVRHPFSRLLSAYRDKINTLTPRPFQPYFLDLQQAIMKKYRARSSNITSPTPTFPEFVDYVIDSTEKLATAKDWIEKVVCWTPYWVQCGVCSSDYQVVIKLETMDIDVQFLAEIAHLKEIQNVHEWKNQRNNYTSSSAFPEYFRELTKNQTLLLYQRYKLDFELFGYSIEDYLSFAKI